MIEIKLVKHSEYKDQLLDLFRISFRREMSEQLWDWKYINNPLVHADPELIVAMENGKIAGARPFMLMEMQIDAVQFIAAEHCDTMVHPEYQNKRIFNKMGRYALQYLKEQKYGLTYGFPNRLSCQGFLKQGYRIVAPTDTLFKPVNAKRLIAQRLKSEPAGHVLGFIYNSLSHLKISRQADHAKGYVIEVFDTYPRELHTLNNWIVPSRIDIVRTEANLRWRFDLNTEHTYKYILVKTGKELVGYAVISLQEQRDGQKRGIIIDYLIKNDDVRCFLAAIEAATHELEKSDCDIIVLWAFSERTFFRCLIENLGFKSTFRFPYNKIMEHGHMDAMLIDDRLDNFVDIYNKDNWRVTKAFADFM